MSVDLGMENNCRCVGLESMCLAYIGMELLVGLEWY